MILNQVSVSSCAFMPQSIWIYNNTRERTLTRTHERTHTQEKSKVIFVFVTFIYEMQLILFDRTISDMTLVT